MRTIFYILFILTISIAYSFSQDTIFLEPSKIFKNEEYKRTKNRFSKELIRFSQDSAIIENCYYLENEKGRIRESKLVTVYKIKDSKLNIWDYNHFIWWGFEQISDTLYRVSNLNETGTANSLIPFVKHGVFAYLSNNDTIIHYEYSNDHLENYWLHKQTIEFDTVFKYNEVDIPPKYSNGEKELAKCIYDKFRKPCLPRESQIEAIVFVSFIVSSSGEINNIRILRGIDNWIDAEAVRVISEIGNFESGIKGGKKVNVEMIVPVKYRLE